MNEEVEKLAREYVEAIDRGDRFARVRIHQIAFQMPNDAYALWCRIANDLLYNPPF